MSNNGELDMLVEKVQSGDSDAMRILGLKMFNGDGVPKDVKKGFQLIEQSVKLGDNLAKYHLASLYLSEGTTLVEKGVIPSSTERIDVLMSASDLLKSFIASTPDDDAMNKAARHFLSMAEDDISKSKRKSNHKSGCYIATCIYGSYDCNEVLILRSYRDSKLKKSRLGRIFISVYYAVSPRIVKIFGSSRWFKQLTKPIIDLVVKKVS